MISFNVGHSGQQLSFDHSVISHFDRHRQTRIWHREAGGLLFARLALPAAGWIDSLVAERFLEPGYQQAAAAVAATTESIERVEAAGADRAWWERYNPVDAIGDRAKKIYDQLAAVGESIVNLAIYFTISTIVLPLGTLWLLSRLTGAFFAARADPLSKG